MQREKNAGQQRQRRVPRPGRAPQGVPFPGEQHGRQQQPRKQHPVKRQHDRRRRRQLHEDGGRRDGRHAERDQPIDVAGCLCHRCSFRGQQPSRKSGLSRPKPPCPRPYDGHRRGVGPQVLGQPGIDLVGRHLLQHPHVLKQRRAFEVVEQKAVGDELQRIKQLHELAHRLALGPPDLALGHAFAAQPLDAVHKSLRAIVPDPAFRRP